MAELQVLIGEFGGQQVEKQVWGLKALWFQEPGMFSSPSP